jgi:hypothetical protein
MGSDPRYGIALISLQNQCDAIHTHSGTLDLTLNLEVT